MGNLLSTASAEELLLLYLTLCGFVSYIPQIIKLIKQRSSENISVMSWAIWSWNAGIYLLYLWLSEATGWLVISQLIELSLIATTFLVVLLFKLPVWVKKT